MRRTHTGTRRPWWTVPLLVAMFMMTSPAVFASPSARPNPPNGPHNRDGWVARLRRTQSFAAPAGDRPTSIQRTGTTVIPNGRIITPAGINLTVAPHPYGLTISPDGKTVVTANSGVWPFSISMVSGVDSSTPAVRQIPPSVAPAPDVINAVFMGMAIAQDNRTLYVSGGNDGNIAVFDLVSGTRTATIDLNVPTGGRAWKDSYIGDLKLTPDGKTLWAVDQANFRIVGVDLASKSVAKVAATGRYPFGLVLTPDGKTAYVANVGMYQYSFVDGYNPNDSTTWLAFPPFGQGSAAARNGTVVDGKHVPGLGDPNAPESFSVWAIRLDDGRTIAQLKTGPLVGQPVEGIPAVGGSSPNSVVTDGKRVYVSNNNSDSIAVIDIATNRVIAQVPLTMPVPQLRKLRGVMPFGLALSPDGRTLYAAESGINAVAVIDTQRLRAVGHIPVGWFPSKLAVSPDGRKLYVANAKGYGSGPNGGPNFTPGPEGTYVGLIQKGTISLIDLPDIASRNGLAQLRTWTNQVLRNNGFVARARTEPGEREAGSPIKHVIFITKENRTYDEVLGDLGTMSNRPVNGVATLARYGQQVTPNHHALARRFAHSDNFYMDSDVSADGHRWLVGAAPNAFVETSWPASYGGRRDFRFNPDTAPGRLGVTESNSALAPEDYPEAGSIWEHLYRNGIEFYNYGEGYEFAGIDESANLEPTGARLPVNVPMPGPLFERTDRNFPTYNTNIPDQYRADEFERDFKARYLAGEDLPPFVNLYFPNDHTAGPRPADGYPARASYVADNDLAVGRVVDLVSHSKYWASTAIFVTEDDSQDGVDHVDAHRSLLLVISPWVKRGYVSGQHTSIPSIIKTINMFTSAPALNLYDATATDLLDLFSDRPDFTPYSAVPTDPAIFDPSKVKRGNFTAADLQGGEEIDNAEVIAARQREEQTPPATGGNLAGARLGFLHDDPYDGDEH